MPHCSRRQSSDVRHVHLDAHIQQTSARRSSTPILSGTLQLNTFILIRCCAEDRISESHPDTAAF